MEETRPQGSQERGRAPRGLDGVAHGAGLEGQIVCHHGHGHGSCACWGCGCGVWLLGV